MKVWVVLEGPDIDSGEVLGVYTTEERAKVAIIHEAIERTKPYHVDHINSADDVTFEGWTGNDGEQCFEALGPRKLPLYLMAQAFEVDAPIGAKAKP